MKISELYGKEIISSNNKRRGYVLGVNLQGDRVAFLYCCDENEREFYVDVNYIISIGEKIVYDDIAARIKRATRLRLGSSTFGLNGRYIGTFYDCEMENYTIKRAYVGGKSYPFSRLVCGDIVLVKDKADGKATTKAANISAPPHELLIDAVLK
jgi:hypothetical protein